MSEPGTSEDSFTTTPQIFCRCCSSPLVQASGWEQDERSCWHVRLWCPECSFERHVVLDRAQASVLSLAIENGFAMVLEALEQFQRSRIRTGTDSAA